MSRRDARFASCAFTTNPNLPGSENHTNPRFSVPKTAVRSESGFSGHVFGKISDRNFPRYFSGIYRGLPKNFAPRARIRVCHIYVCLYMYLESRLTALSLRCASSVTISDTFIDFEIEAARTRPERL